MLEIKNTITEMANAFDESINNWTRLRKKHLWAWGYDNRNFWQLKSRENKEKKKERERICKIYVKVKVAQLCPMLCDPMDYTDHGILQGRILEWVAFPFSRGSSQPRGQTQVSHIAGRSFTSWATREALGQL